jgi:hypothetical protein
MIPLFHTRVDFVLPSFLLSKSINQYEINNNRNFILFTCVESCLYRTPNRSLDKILSGKNGQSISNTGNINCGSILSGLVKPNKHIDSLSLNSLFSL